jgi:hypothetical protein
MVEWQLDRAIGVSRGSTNGTKTSARADERSGFLQLQDAHHFSELDAFRRSR